jgi:two-component system, NarL family, sensor kinase
MRYILCIVIISITYQKVGAQPKSKLDSLANLINTTKVDTVKVWSLIEWGNEIEGSKPEEAYKLYKQAEAISRKINYPFGIVKAISNFTYILDLQNKYKASKPYYEEAVMLAKKHKLGPKEGHVIANLGTWYYRNSDFVKCLEYYQQAWKISDKYNDFDFSINLKANTGVIYESLKRYDEGIALCDEVLKYTKGKEAMNSLQLQALNNKGICQQGLLKWKESISTLEQALALAKKEDNKELLSACYNNLSTSYRRLGDQEKSFSYAKLGLALTQEIGETDGIISLYHSIGNYYFFKDAIDSAEHYFNLALNLSEENKLLEIQGEVYSSQAHLHLRKGNMKLFTYYNTLADSIETKIQGSQVQSTAKEMEVKYETEKKQNEILQKNIELEKTRSNNQALGFGLVSILLLGGFGFYTFRKNQKHKVLQSALESQQRERQRIASEMHDDIGGDLTSLMYLAHQLKSPNSSNQLVDKVINKSSEISETVNEIVWSLNESNNKLQDWAVFVRGRMGEILQDADQDFSINISNDLPDVTLNSEVKRNLYLCVKECINNAIKHAQATHIALNLEANNGIKISIIDNGIGLHENSAPKIGHKNGLKNIQKRMADIGGSVEWISDKGTKVVIYLPI